MYSDSDLPSDMEVLPLRSHRRSLTGDGGSGADVAGSSSSMSSVDAINALADDGMDAIEDALADYALLFEGEHSTFYKTLPSYYIADDVHAARQQPDLSNLIDVYVEVEQPHRQSHPEQSAPSGEEAGAVGDSSAATPRAETLPINEELTGVVREADAGEGSAGDSASAPKTFVTKPSPASRFLELNLDTCLLIPINPQANRSAVREQHTALRVGSESATVDFAVGYNGREPVGWALPLTTDTAVLDALREQHPGARAAVPSDVTFFMRWESSRHRSGGNAKAKAHTTVKNDPVRTVAAPVARQQVRVSRLLSRRMSSVDTLLACVEAAGGWQQVRWVALDVEVAVISKGMVPVPLEFAFVPMERDVPTMHFFTSPGFLSLSDEIQAKHTSGMLHHIPIANASFLRTDYGQLAAAVKESFLDDTSVILVSKGSPESPALADVQSVRWLFAAASACAASPGGDGTVPLPIPAWDDVRCFDISVVEKALSLAPPASVKACAENAAGSKVEGVTETYWRNKRPRACWYHSAMDEAMSQESQEHCAHYDACVLRNTLEAALSGTGSHLTT